MSALLSFQPFKKGRMNTEMISNRFENYVREMRRKETVTMRGTGGKRAWSDQPCCFCYMYRQCPGIWHINKIVCVWMGVNCCVHGWLDTYHAAWIVHSSMMACPASASVSLLKCVCVCPSLFFPVLTNEQMGSHTRPRE